MTILKQYVTYLDLRISQEAVGSASDKHYQEAAQEQEVLKIRDDKQFS